MSDPYSVEPRMSPAPKPSGLGALISSMVSGAMPTQMPQESSSPMPEDPSGRGGFLSGLNIPRPPTAFPPWLTGLPSTLQDLVKRAVEPPASWLEPPPQGGADVRSGVYEPPVQRPLLGVEPPPGVSTRSPGQTDWPATGETTGKKEPPDTSKPPPEPKGEPRQEPRYIPSRRDPPADAWGKPDLVLQGMQNYPGMLPAPYGPQPHEWSGIMRGSATFLGRLGSGVVAPLAMSLLQLEPSYWKARQAGEDHNAKMRAANIALLAKQITMKQAAESREYGEAIAAYGPHTENGKTVPGDPQALEQAIRRIAAAAHDTKIPAVLDRAGLPAVIRMIQSRDAHNTDLIKVLTQQQKQNAIREQELRIKLLEEKVEAARKAKDVGLSDVVPGTAPAAGTPGGTPTAPDPHELDPYTAPTPGTPDADVPAAPAETSETDATTPAATAEPSETDEAKPEAKAETQQDDQEAQRETPSAAAETPATAAAGTPQAAAPARPVRLAMLDTGTVSDAPRPGETPAPAETPAPTKEAQAQPQVGRPGPELQRPAAGTPEAMGAGSPVPSLEPTTTGQAAAPAQPTPPAAPAAPYEFKPSTAVLDRARKIRRVDSEGQTRGVDITGIETLAQQMANHTIRIQDLRIYPDWYKQIARQRGDEIIADMYRLAHDPRVAPKDVIRELDKFNPEFAAQLKGMVEGRSALPTSQWANPGYKARAVLLGSKIEPSFNEGTAKNIFKTYEAFSTGRQGDWITAVGTTYGHGSQLEEDVKKYPNLVARVLSGTPIGSLVASKAEIDTMARIKAEISTFNAEYEYAVSRGRPSVWARREQAEQAAVVFGNKETLLANIAAKKALLRTRYGELAAQFKAGTGQQPKALLNRLEEIGNEGSSGLAQLDRDRRAGARMAPAGPGSPMETPEGRAGLDTQEGVVDYRTFFEIH